VAKLIYSTIASLDGYVADAHGKSDWAAPDEEVHAYVQYRAEGRLEPQGDRGDRQ
jgi:riboflavin biosynthesis pyrimidine reductase